MSTQHPADRDAIVAAMDRALAAGWPLRAELAGPGIGAARLGDQELRLDRDARLVLMLEGSQRRSWMRDGGRRDQDLRQGEGLFLPPRAWMLARFTRPCQLLGLVFRSGFLRALVSVIGGDGTIPEPARALHTARPLGGAGAYAVKALARLAEHGDSAAARDLFIAVLRLAREHLAEDLGRPRGAAALWAELNELVQLRYRDLDRGAAARALGVHPNSLSALCSRQGGTTFAELLRETRLDHARHLLRSSSLHVADVGRLCGFAAPSHFCRSFRAAVGDTPARWRAHR